MGQRVVITLFVNKGEANAKPVQQFLSMIQKMDLGSECGAEYLAVVKEDSANAKPFGHMIVDTLSAMYERKKHFILSKDKDSAIKEILKLFHRVGCLLLEAESIQIEKNSKLGLDKGEPVISGELGEVVRYLRRDIKIKPRQGKKRFTKIRWIRGKHSIHEVPAKLEIVAQACQLLHEAHKLNFYYLVADIANLEIIKDGSLTSVPNRKAEEDMLALMRRSISAVKDKRVLVPADRVVIDCSELPKYYFLHRDSYNFKRGYYRLQAHPSFHAKIRCIFDAYSGVPEKKIQAQPITFRQLIQQKELRRFFNKSYGPDATTLLDTAPLESFQKLDVVRGERGLIHQSVLGPYHSHEAMFLLCALANAIPGLPKAMFNVNFIKSVMECGELVSGPSDASLFLRLRFKERFVSMPLLCQAPKGSIVTSRVTDEIVLFSRRGRRHHQPKRMEARDEELTLTKDGFLTNVDLSFRTECLTLLDQFADKYGEPKMSKGVVQSISLAELLEQKQVKHLLENGYGRGFLDWFYYPTSQKDFSTWAACFKQLEVVKRDDKSTKTVFGPYCAYRALLLLFALGLKNEVEFDINFIRLLMKETKEVSLSEGESLCLCLRFSVPDNYNNIWECDGSSVHAISYTTKTIFVGSGRRYGVQLFESESQSTTQLALTTSGFEASPDGGALKP